ncbi:hypothetical protein NUW58_g8162 [Xylaria curta]|uniref:Uncharacterized protein n=1 Tax=Xylaria curta TaxID=42375 RepID=A0ACC1NAW4_9PEZI|nr:hypothetical protein NUW58_g8162 [Xylaria curta]
MKFLTALALLGVAQAHYTFPGLVYNGVTEADWTYVRQTTNHYSHGPVENVNNAQIRCYEITPGSNGAKTKNVNAGDTVGFRVDGGIQHPGPLQFYMAKAPAARRPRASTATARSRPASPPATTCSASNTSASTAPATTNR